MKSETYKEESAVGQLKKNLKGLTFEQKVEHILSYYWGTILLIILIPTFLVLILVSVFKNNPEVVFGGNCTNVTLTDEGQSYLINDWNALLDMEPGTLGLTLKFTTTVGLDSYYEVDGGIRVVAEIAADSLDYIFCDQVGMDYFAAQRAFLPLDTALDGQTLSAWSDKLYYFFDEEDGISYAAGIDVSEMPFVRDCIPEEGPVYFFFANREEPEVERLQLFFSFLNNWDQMQK